MINENVALWAVREIRAQRDEIEHVKPLYHAYFRFKQACYKRSNLLDVELIRRLGHWVKPDVNSKDGYRTHNFTVGVDDSLIPGMLRDWCERWNTRRYTSVTTLFVEFEKIHPFNDGNGRSGAIIANVLAGVPEDRLAVSWEIYSFRDGRSRWDYD